MTTPKQDLKRLKIITACHEHVRAKGAHARIVIRMPGLPRGQTGRRFSAKGPRGQIITQTHDCKKILVMFKADQLLTSLEVIRNGSTTD
jgi:hypothetical protein